MLKQKAMTQKAENSAPAIATAGVDGFKVTNDYRHHRGLTPAPALRGGLFVPRLSAREGWEFVPETQEFTMDGKYVFFPLQK